MIQNIRVRKNGILYYGSNELDNMMAWDPETRFVWSETLLYIYMYIYIFLKNQTNKKSLSSARVVFSSTTDENWADTLGFNEESKSLIWTTNKLSRFFAGTLDKDPRVLNFRILSASVDSVSYVNSGDPQPPSAPCSKK